MATVGEKMTAIANAIRTKTGGTDKLTLDTMASSLNNIPERTSSNLSASGATVTVPAGNYKAQATKSVATATQATPSITVSRAGLITASATQAAGYVTAGTKTATHNLTTQAAQTITPGTSNKTIASGRYLTGTQTIKGDSNLVSGNIKQGVSIFGVSGSFEGNDPQVFTGSVTGRGTNFNEDVNCGFQPDFVIVYIPDSYTEWDNTLYNSMGAYLGDMEIDKANALRCQYGHVDGSTANSIATTFGCYITKTENGFSLGSFLEVSQNGEFAYSTKTVQYKAIKF